MNHLIRVYMCQYINRNYSILACWELIKFSAESLLLTLPNSSFKFHSWISLENCALIFFWNQITTFNAGETGLKEVIDLLLWELTTDQRNMLWLVVNL